jgi:hypothetical protein
MIGHSRGVARPPAGKRRSKHIGAREAREESSFSEEKEAKRLL